MNSENQSSLKNTILHLSNIIAIIGSLLFILNSWLPGKTHQEVDTHRTEISQKLISNFPGTKSAFMSHEWQAEKKNYIYRVTLNGTGTQRPSLDTLEDRFKDVCYEVSPALWFLSKIDQPAYSVNWK